MNTVHITLDNEDYQHVLNKIRTEKGEEEAALLIKKNMEKILVHYIGCTWGACCNAKFNDLIKPYFDDVKLLDKILRSNHIENRFNVIMGKTGARIFDMLLFELRKCESQEIRNYLSEEFPIGLKF